MNIKTQDPFRFLTRIKKSLTPLKQRPIKTQSIADTPDSLTQIEKMSSADESVDKSTISKLYGQTFRSRPAYDPSKYYSQKNENYLKTMKIKANPQYKENEILNNRQPQIKMVNDYKKKYESKTQTINDIDMSSITNRDESQMKTDNKRNSQRMQQYKQTVNQITFKKLQFDHVQGHIGSFNKEDAQNLQFFEGQEQTNQQTKLRQCDICLRNFNLKSYEKHVKICEKVFMKKRKPFSSEKQRSLSKDKKKG